MLTIYIDNIFGMSIEVASIIVPTIVTIVIFVLGYLINLLIHYIKSIIARRNIRRSVIAWIEIVKVPLQRDIVELEKIAKDSRENEMLQQPRMEWNSLLGEKIEAIITQDIMNILLKRRYTNKAKKDQQRLIYNLVSQTHYISVIEKEIVKTYEKYESQSNKLSEEWNELYSQIKEIIENLLRYKLICGRQTTTALNSIIQAHTKEIAQNPHNFKTSYESLIPQLKNNLFVNDGDFIELLNLLPKAEYIYVQWMTNNNGFGRLFEDYARALGNTLSILNGSKERI